MAGMMVKRRSSTWCLLAFVLGSSQLERSHGWVGVGAGSIVTTPKRSIAISPLFGGAIPPDDSPYAKPEEELSVWPKTYVGNQARWGSLKPGIKKENAPIQEVMKEEIKVPWPAFQEWPWHYRWVCGIDKRESGGVMIAALFDHAFCFV